MISYVGQNSVRRHREFPRRASLRNEFISPRQRTSVRWSANTRSLKRRGYEMLYSIIESGLADIPLDVLTREAMVKTL